MNLAGLMAIALCAPGCETLFPLEEPIDKVPHIPATEDEEPGTGSVEIVEFFQYNTTAADEFPGGTIQKLKQDGADSDVVVLRADTVTIGPSGVLRLFGDSPFIILARTIQVDGAIDASAFPAATPLRAPGGGRPGEGDPGEGGVGVKGADRLNTGGGGGGMAPGAGAGGMATCGAGVPGGKAGEPVSDETLLLLVGGGAGGSGSVRCTTMVKTRGGFGGGALQLSATESITISATGRIRASGGGGGGGAGVDDCPAEDDAGSGGGAGGAIYLDAPRISNSGGVEAHGGGGGGGGGDKSLPDMLGTDGQLGHFGNETVAVVPETEPRPSGGGSGRRPKGTFGGNGAHGDDLATPGEGGCAALLTVNTGGGGGAFGRIVVRVEGEVSPFGSFTPPPFKIAYPIP